MFLISSHPKLRVFANWWYFLIPLFILMLLLARNPFSERTLIANFEPFPDSFHYVTPVRCWLSGFGWNICREGRTITPAVPPLYGLTLLPLIFIWDDPRVFYFTNVLLSICSFFLMVAVMRKLKIFHWIQFLVLSIYVTTYVIYWFPALPMAENLLSTIVLIGVLLLIQTKIKPIHIVLAAFTTTATYATKYSALGLTATLFLLFIWKFFAQKNNSRTVKNFITLIIITTLSFLIVDQGKMVTQIFPILQTWIWPNTTPANQVVAESSWWLSPVFFVENIGFYFKGILGADVPILWEKRAFIPHVLTIFTFGLALLTVVLKKERFITLALLSLIFLPVIPLSFFYAPNFRYLLYIVPLFILLLAHTLHLSIQTHISASQKALVIGTFVLLLSVTFFQRLQPIKYQIVLNLKYAETPWWYVAARDTDAFLTGEHQTGERPILITAIPAHLYDFYSMGKVQLLPLSYDHDFRQNRLELFGEYDYSNLIELYKKFLRQGRAVYVTNYGLGNEQPRHEDFANIQQFFNLELVQSRCYELCNLWKLTEKSTPQALSPKK